MNVRDGMQHHVIAAETPVARIMYPKPIAVREHDTVIATAARMAIEHVRHACVVDEDDRVIGILSDRDVRHVLGDVCSARAPDHLPEHLHRLRTGQLMTLKPKCVNQDAPISEALAMLMTEQHLGALPVVDGQGRLRGIVSYVDVLRLVAGDVEEK